MATLSTISTSVIDRFKKNESTLDTAFVYNDSGTLEGKGGCWYTDKTSLGENGDVPNPANDYVVFQIGMRNKADRTQFYCDGNMFSKRQVDNTSDDAFSDWVQQNKAVLTESYKSGTSWYRKYSDGWIEQGGLGTGQPYNGTANTSLITAFSDTNYLLMLSAKSMSHYNDTSMWSTKATSYFRAHTGFNASSTQSSPFSWYACGF